MAGFAALLPENLSLPLPEMGLSWTGSSVLINTTGTLMDAELPSLFTVLAKPFL
ncbi:MAG: hypothetical protein Q6354_02630 [Candidatus Brocadiales bacterium]|nr:hypothetical protein [Candidatus Brocadiales bacterium]